VPRAEVRVVVTSMKIDWSGKNAFLRQRAHDDWTGWYDVEFTWHNDTRVVTTETYKWLTICHGYNCPPPKESETHWRDEGPWVCGASSTYALEYWHDSRFAGSLEPGVKRKLMDFLDPRPPPPPPDANVSPPESPSMSAGPPVVFERDGDTHGPHYPHPPHGDPPERHKPMPPPRHETELETRLRLQAERMAVQQQMNRQQGRGRGRR
jgi:hypothetical protein